jgi:hypothetical protein
MKIGLFFGKYREFILQLQVATDLLALPLPNKTKTLWPPKSLFLASKKKNMKTVQDILLDFFFFNFHQAAPDLPGPLVDNFS